MGGSQSQASGGPSLQDRLKSAAAAAQNAASAANSAALAAAQGLNTGAQTVGTLGQAAGNFLSSASQAAGNVQQMAGPLTFGGGISMTAYGLAKRHHMKLGGGVYGGGGAGGFFGGGDDSESSEPARELREYEASLAAKTKEETIRRLARAMKRAGINVDPEGDLDAIAKALVAQIPNPRHGKTFAADAKSQEKVCKTIADVLNDEFSPGAVKAADKFIDTSLGPVNVCRQVAQWVHSFLSGVSAEFMEVNASVRRVLRNIQVLEQVMDELYRNIVQRIPDANKTGVSAEIGNFDEVYRRALSARKQQEEILKNFLHVTLAPAQKELELALQDRTEAHELVEKLGLKPGTTGFADSLAMAISGIGTVAAVAQRVNKALKDVGLSVSQYLDSADMQSLNRLLDDKMMSGAFKSEDVGKFLEAVQTLRQNFDRRVDLKPGFEELSSRTGGADDDEKSEVVRRVEKLKSEKKLLMKEFADRLKTSYSEIFAAAKTLSSKLGKEIPITTKTDMLRDALERLRNQTRAGAVSNIEIALVGLAVNVESREQKERFQSSLRLVSGTLSSLMELEIYRGASGVFSQLKSAIDNLDKLVSHFSDIVTKKYGGDGDMGADEYSGGDLSEFMSGITTSSLNLNEALSSFIYAYYIAKVRENLSQTSKELAQYGEKYTDVLGDAVAARVRTLENERKVIDDYLADRLPYPAGYSPNTPPSPVVQERPPDSQE